MGNSIDIRIIQLAKWQIPKSKSVLYRENSRYLSIGYFDMVSVKKVDSDGGQHPLMSAYKASHRHSGIGEDSLLMDYTMQEMIVFTNMDKFGRERVEQFWEDEDLLLFVSLIHVDNESNLKRITDKIDRLFGKIEYLYYFSLDYSGIVIMAKKSGLQEYLELMFCLNYDNSDEKLIRDSYSLYGFNKKNLMQYFNEFRDMPYDAVAVKESKESFSASVNIGIQNYNTYKAFLEELESVDPQIKKYGLFGRHDVSIVNDQADLKWLIYVQYLLDKYTSVETCEGSNKLFSTHETFIKLSGCDSLKDTDVIIEDPYYELAKDKLLELSNTFSEKLDRRGDKYNGEYKIPVQAIVYSILSIMKNRFAEDFVLCMYQSFTDFLSYLIEKVSDEGDSVQNFDRCYRNYFRGLNSLVNSAMHSERQFIQATAFNAIIYDVPSKIMAFYIAVIDDIQRIMRGNSDKRYTFLLTPSFCDEISVEIISYKNDMPPHDRILMVEINEESLYNPRAVVRRMAHEIAHFVGDELRNRSIRKNYLKRSVIYLVLSHLLHKSFLETDHFYELIDRIEELLPVCRLFRDDTMNYSNDLRQVCIQVGDQFKTNERIKDALLEYIYGILADDLGKTERGEEIRKYIAKIVRSGSGAFDNYFMKMAQKDVYSENELTILRDIIWQDILKELQYINRDRDMLLEMGKISQSTIMSRKDAVLADTTLGEYGKRLIMAYSEAFADVQMALLLDISYTDYLMGFLREEKLVLEELPHRSGDLLRISMVVMTLQSTGFWDCKLENGEYAEDESLRKFHELLKRRIQRTRLSFDGNDSGQNEEYCDLVQYFRERTQSRKGVFRGNDDVSKQLEEEAEQYDKGHVYLDGCIYQYLLQCLGQSIEQYSQKEKAEQIIGLRRVIRVVTKCENVFDMFSVICEEINAYKEKIMK